MKEKNTLSHTGFIVLLYFSGMLTFYLFCRDMHKQIGRVPVKAMIVFMILLLCVFSAVNYLVSRKKNRNLSSIFANMIIPEGVYIVYLYRKWHGNAALRGFHQTHFQYADRKGKNHFGTLIPQRRQCSKKTPPARHG